MEPNRIKILAIDDNNDNLITINALLKDIFPGVEVHTATSGKEGIERARLTDPDVILLDILMPGMDGFTVCRELKGTDATKEIPVVFVTALKGEKQLRTRALEVGGDGFLSKPIDESELKAQVLAMVKIKAGLVRVREEKKWLIEQVAIKTSELRAELEERKQSERQLELSASIVQHIQIGLYIYKLEDLADDRSLRMVFANPASAEFSGVAVADVLGKTLDESFPDLREKGIPQIYADVVRTGKVIFLEDVYYSSTHVVNGAFSVKAFPLPDNKVGVSFESITERKKIEVALLESELNYRTLADSGQSLIWTAGTDKLCYYFNKVWLVFTGRTLEQEIGNGWVDGVHPDDLDRCIALYTTAFDKREPFSMDYRLRCHTGEYRWIQDDGCPRYDRLGVFVGYIGNCLDINARKLVDQRLRSSEERFRTMFQQAPIGIALIDSHSGHIYEVNPRFAQIAGRTCSEMVKINWMDITHPDDIQEDLENMNLMNSGKIPGFTMKKRYIHPDGSHVWIQMTIAPMIVEDKSKPCHLCMIEDITELRAIELRLRQSEKMEAIGILAGGIAHDFNNVLGGIIGYTDLSLDLVEKESLLDNNLRKVLKAADRAKHLVKQILTFSHQGLQPKSVIAVRPIVKEVLELLRASIPSSVIIEFDLHKDTGMVVADPTKIHEMLLNLATNAVHAMERKGTLTVRLYAETVDKEILGRSGTIERGDYAVIEVADTGHGMDEQVLKKAFDPFFTTKPVGEGTGMGLAVVLGVAQSHGGDLQVESVVGRGTVFRIFLPVSHEAETVDRTDEAVGQAGGTERILFVDDEPALLELALEMLCGQGYRVTGFLDSKEAYRFIQEKSNEIDIVVTDQTMPGMTGIELAKAAIKIRSDLPIILCTGFSAEINPERAAAIGIRQVLMKPYGFHEIRIAIRDILDNNNNNNKEAAHGTHTGD